MSDAGGTPVVNDASNDAADARAKQLAEDVQKAKDAGWSNPIPFNYEMVAGGEADVLAPVPGAPWLSDAAVYEWQDDFGTVGPRNEDLERELFDDPDMQRAGTGIQALEFEVKVEGKEKLHPVRSVSKACLLFYRVRTIFNAVSSSTRRVFILSCWKTSISADMRFQLLSSRTAFPPCSLAMMLLASLKLVCLPNMKAHLLVLTFARLWQDGSLPSPDLVQTHGQGQHPGGSASQSDSLQPGH